MCATVVCSSNRLIFSRPVGRTHDSSGVDPVVGRAFLARNSLRKVVCDHLQKSLR
jgi:hypothetical protein